MASLESLKQLIDKLHPYEVETCRDFLSAFNKRGIFNKHKIETLFDFLLNTELGNIKDDAVEHLIYGKKSKIAFEKLRDRLKDKILESLILDKNIYKDEVLPRARVILSIRKEISYAQIIQSRGLVKEAITIYDSVIKNGTVYEIWDEVMIALKLKRSLVALSEGINSFRRVSKEYRRIKSAAVSLNRAEYYYNRLGLITNFRKWTFQDTELLRFWISEVNELYQKSPSKYCEFFLLHLEITFYQKSGQFQKAEDKLIRLMDLVKSEKIIHTKTKMASSILNYAENNIYSGNFATSFIKAEEALEYIENNHITALRCYELQYYSMLYNCDYLKAIAFISKSIENSEDAAWLFNKGRWKYQTACCLFLLNDIKAADGMLIDLNPIENDKEGFNLYMKILIVLICIERGKDDVTISKLEGLRKLISSIRRKKTDEFRGKLIYQILKELIKNNYDYKATRISMSNSIVLLTNDPLYRWNVLSPEVVIFEQWFMAKAEGRKFTQKIIVPFSSDSNLQIAV